MINTARPSNNQHSLHTSVQNLRNNVAELPSGAVLLDSLKILEMQLQRREMVSNNSLNSNHPLWFLAETERNVFLWRAGFSLIDGDQFEFWVDIPKLVEKRLKQLDNYNGDNPFLNPLWGSAVCNPDSAAHERDYLLSFQEIIASIAMHASALSSVTSMIRQEMLNEEAKSIVLLPCGIEASA